MNAAIESVGVAHLQTPQRFWLWALRAWAAFHTDLTCVWWSLDRAFTNEGIRPALLPFHEMMTVLFAEVRCWPDIRCVICPQLSGDEARFLSVLASLQHGDELGARKSLQSWVPRAVARIAYGHAQQCAAIAAEAGFKLDRCGEAQVESLSAPRTH